MKIQRLTDSSSQPLYQITALNNVQMMELESMTNNQLYDLVRPYNFGGVIKARHDYSVTIQVFTD
jgi:hypothetical protein